MAPIFHLEVTGDKIFDKWDLVNNKISTIWELDANSKHFTFFFRDEIFIDFVYLGNEQIPSESQKHAAANASDALEFYLEGRYSDFTCRIGRQIVQWGESIAPVFAPTVNVVNALFAMKATSAGYTTRDYYVPSYMLWANYELAGNTSFVNRINRWVNLSFEAVYAPYFEPRDGLPVVGTFMSPVDLIGYGARDLVLGFMRVEDLRPTAFEDMQQYGGAIRMIFPKLASLEMGLYYYHYLDRMPSMELVEFSMSPNDAKVELTYPEIDMFGMSLSHAIQALNLNLQLGGDLAYRPNAPLARHYWLPGALLPWALGTDTMGPMAPYDEGETLNWAINGLRFWFDVLPCTPWTVTATGMFEFYGGINLDYENGHIPNSNKRSYRSLYNDYTAPEYTVYYMVNPSFTCSDMIDNTKLTFSFTALGNLHEEQNSLHHFIYSLEARYGDSWEVTLGYDQLIGDIMQDTKEYPAGIMTDRDAITIKLAYFFI